MRQALRRVALGAAVGLLPLAACGDDDDATPTIPEPGGASDDTTGGEAPSSLDFEAEDIAFARDEVSAAAGELDVELVNEGAIEHSWLVEGHEDELRLYVQATGDTDQGTITLEAGSYEYYCDIPGHREAGMEGTLTVG